METHFRGEDMARIICAFKPELSDSFGENYPSIQRRMNDICANPQRPVNLRTADSVVTAMGCPHVLTNGAVRVLPGYNRKESRNGRALYAGAGPPDMLPAAPLRKWLERQSRHYPTLTAMYNDLDLGPQQGSSIWRGTTKQLDSRTVAAALARRGVELHEVYPASNGNGKVI